MTTGEIPGFESKRLRTKNRLPENLVTPPNPVEPEPNRGRQKADALPKVPSATKHLLYRKIAISLPPSFEGGRLLFLLLKSFAATAGPIKSVAK